MRVRADRLATLYLFRPLLRIIPAGGIPILMYHSIREGSEGRHAYYETNTSPRIFAEHMKILHEEGYRALKVTKPSIGNNGSVSPKSVVITFDDGYADFYRYAFPILTELNFTATVFVVSGLLKTHRECFKGIECLNLAEVRELHSAGISIGSHTVSHPELKRLSPQAVENEVAASKKTLEDALGAPIKSFSYPFAFPEADRRFVNRLADILEACGYENGVTTILGTARPGAPRWFLPRLPVNSCDDPGFFRAKLAGAYDWMHAPQYLCKFLGGGWHE